MDNDIRKRAYDFVISDIRNYVTKMQASAKERCDKGQNPGAVYRLTAIESILNFLETITPSSKPWIHFTHEKTYDTRRMTKQVITLLKKHNVIDGEETAKDIYVQNAFSKS